MILGSNIGGRDVYQATPEAVKMRDKEMKNIKVSKKIDLFIKKQTKKRLKWEACRTRNWWVVPLITLLFSALLSGIASYTVYYFTHKK
jgi:hypothetical protein